MRPPRSSTAHCRLSRSLRPEVTSPASASARVPVPFCEQCTVRVCVCVCACVRVCMCWLPPPPPPLPLRTPHNSKPATAANQLAHTNTKQRRRQRRRVPRRRHASPSASNRAVRAARRLLGGTRSRARALQFGSVCTRAHIVPSTHRPNMHAAARAIITMPSPSEGENTRARTRTHVRTHTGNTHLAIR